MAAVSSSKGIAVISSYRGGYNFEAVGLSRALVADFFPGMPTKISGEGYHSLFLSAQERHERAFDEAATALRADCGTGILPVWRRETPPGRATLVPPSAPRATPLENRLNQSSCL